MRTTRRNRQLLIESLENRLAPATVYWDVDADGFWDVPTNWRDDLGANRLPGPTDDVIIDRPAGNFTITHRTNDTTIRSLTSREAFSLTGGRLLPQTASVLHAAFTFSGGWRDGPANLTVHGPFSWTSGVMEGGGVTTVSASSTLDITGGFVKEIRGGHMLNNAGTIRISGQGGFLNIGDAGSTFNNLAGATLRTLDSTQIDPFLGGGAFHNAGTLHVQNGTLWLGVSGTNTGTWQLDAGTTLVLRNSQELRPEAQIQGPGLLRLAGAINHTLAVRGSLTVANLELTGGNIHVTGSLAVSQQFTWIGGFLEGAGTTTIPANATLRIQDFVLKRLSAGHTLTNAGTVLFAGDRINLDVFGTLNNQVGATLRVQVQDQVQFLPAVQSGTFNNAGLVEVLGGNVLLGPRPGTSGGTFQAAAGARMTLPSGHTFQSGAAFTGPGLKTLNGQVNLVGSFVMENVQFSGTLTGTHTLSGTVAWRAGSISGPGTTTFTADSTLTIGGISFYQYVENGRVIHNHGTAVMVGGNELNLYGDGNTWMNEPGGVFRVPTTSDIAALGSGAFVNAGTLELESGTLQVSARFTNTGTVRVQAGTLHLASTFTNFAGQTLTGGAYEVAGTLKFTGADVRTNAAALVLDGPNVRVVNQANGDALANFATNAMNGSFTVRNTAYLFRAGGLSNAGTVRIEQDSFAWLTGVYTQTAGRTQLSGGGLIAASVGLQGGTLDGSGYVLGDVVNAARIDVGGAQAAGVLFLLGNYTQTAAGSLTIELGGLELGSQYDYLYIDGTAALDGTLNLVLLNGFIPNADDFFVILSAASISGDFTTINGQFIGTNRGLYPFHDGMHYYLWTYVF